MKELVQQLLAIENFDVFLVLGILIFFGLIESFAGYLRHSKRKKGLVTRGFEFFLAFNSNKTYHRCERFIQEIQYIQKGKSLVSTVFYHCIFWLYPG